MSLPPASVATASTPVASAVTGPVPAHQAVKAAAKSGSKTQNASNGDGFSFKDFLDIVNPLQHIPIVSSIYREITGDKITGAARIVGGALFGGPIGAVLGGINAIVAAENNGKDVGELALNEVGIGDKKTETAKVARKDDKNIPVIEVHPSDKVSVASIDKMPFARIDKSQIVWDDNTAVKVAAVNKQLPQAKQLNDLKPVAGFDPVMDDAQTASLDKMPALKSDDAAALNAIEPGAKTDEIVEIDPAMDAKLAKLAAVSNTAPAVAPIDTKQLPDQMLTALAKYQKMQGVSDKAVISPKLGTETAAATTIYLTPQEAANAALAGGNHMPFAGLGKNVRRYNTH